MVGSKADSRFFINKCMGNVIEDRPWFARSSAAPAHMVNESGDTVLQVSSTKPSYLIANGNTGDFKELHEEHGFKLGDRNTIIIQSYLTMSMSENRKIAVLEYDENRQRVGEFFLDVNRLCYLTVGPTTHYILLALRFQGPGDISVQVLQADVLSQRSSVKGPMIEYRPVASMAETSTLDRIEAALKKVEEALPPQTGRLPDTYFSPLGIPSSQILNKPSAHLAGRLAADQTNSGDSENVVFQLVEEDKLNRSRKIAIVSTEWLRKGLETVGEVVSISPGRELGTLDAETAYFVIDEEASITGPWSGLLDAQGTSKFSKLHDSILEARSNGVVIIVLASNVPGHYSQMLRRTADVLIEHGFAHLPWEADIDLPVIHEIETLTQEHIQK